jgi:hypothetical protein
MASGAGAAISCANDSASVNKLGCGSDVIDQAKLYASAAPKDLPVNIISNARPLPISRASRRDHRHATVFDLITEHLAAFRDFVGRVFARVC